ncbi:MAG: cyclic nucleotide-binding domain-containing protein [Deltaproteobacteria bacterium]|nr:cyclic nucleotide-binding domain-containing protein [Deltaproteobacteria bacterium]
MINSRGVSEELEKQYGLCKAIAREVYDLVSHLGTPKVLLRDKNLLVELPSNTVSFVTEGYLKLVHDNREIRMFSNGDFIPVTGGWAEEYRISSDFKSELMIFPHLELVEYICKKEELGRKWAELCAMEQRLQLCLCGEFAPEIIDCEMVVKTYSKGDVIMNPNSTDGTVFEMISGKADVFVDDILVGTVGNNELFGELTLLVPDSTPEKVIARKNCFVRQLDSRAFTHLIESNSQFAVTLLKNLASKIEALHQLATHNHNQISRPE